MIIIRDASEHDIANIRRLAHAGIEESIECSAGDIVHIDDYKENDAFIKEGFESGALVMVAEDEGAIVGWIMAYPMAQPVNAPFYREFKRLYIDTVDVLKSRRDEGIGEMLFAEVEKRASVMGIEELLLDVYYENTGARLFYDSMNFKVHREQRIKKISPGT
jgi:ribosomal protein S18 acetylase RimI-like enzyme